MCKTVRKYLLNPTSLIGLGTLAVTLVIFFAQGGFGKMTDYTYLYIIGLVFGVAMILYGLIKQVSQDKKDKQIGENKGNPEIGKRCIEILRRLHERTLQLKDKSVRQYWELFRFKDFWELCNTIMNIEVKDKKVIAGVAKFAGKKKLKQDKTKKRQQVDGLFDKVNQMIQVEWDLEKLLAFSNEIEKLPNEQNSKYKGIKARRGTDKKWNKLFDKLNNLKLQHSDIFADKELNKMVNDYIDYSFGLSSLCLAIDIYNKNVPIELQPTKYIDSGLYDPYVKLSEHMTQLLNIVANKIEELQNIPKTEGQQP